MLSTIMSDAAIKQVKFKETFPSFPSHSHIFMLEAMTYKVTLEIPACSNIAAERDVVVQAWTSQCDRLHSDGQWHSLDLPYCETTGEDLYLFGHSEFITSDSEFRFTFRVRLVGDETWRWSHGWREDCTAYVEPPRPNDGWTRGPDYTPVISSLHLGNFIAAARAPELGFTHVLNVADNLDMVYNEGEDVTYLKISMKDGGSNHIDDHKIARAVEWLKTHDQPGHKLLVNCRAGIGRAGSVAVAYVFAKQKSFSYDEAYQFVFKKRFVYPHKGLQETLYLLFPRE